MSAEYFAPHIRLIHELRLHGIFHSINDRLPLAWYKHHLKKLAIAPEKLTRITSLIDECIILRREGQEPPHKDERYI